MRLLILSFLLLANTCLLTKVYICCCHEKASLEKTLVVLATCFLNLLWRHGTSLKWRALCSLIHDNWCLGQALSQILKCFDLPVVLLLIVVAFNDLTLKGKIVQDLWIDHHFGHLS